MCKRNLGFPCQLTAQMLVTKEPVSSLIRLRAMKMAASRSQVSHWVVSAALVGVASMKRRKPSIWRALPVSTILESSEIRLGDCIGFAVPTSTLMRFSRNAASSSLAKAKPPMKNCSSCHGFYGNSSVSVITTPLIRSVAMA